MVSSNQSMRPTSSRASSRRSLQTQSMENIAASGDTGVVTSSPYSALHQFSQQLGDSDDENQEQEARSEGGDGDFEEESDLVVLDPDHPLMNRFQTALKNYLSKQLNNLDMELREMNSSFKKNKTEREELGVILYGIQQELARLQMGLEKHQDKHSQVSVVRRQKEEELEKIRNLYKNTHQITNEERKKVSSMQTEVENLALRLFYMQNVNQDVRSDISLMKRAVQKAEAERVQAEIEKQKQDMFVDRLTREADRLREQIALYEAQVSAQREDTKAAREVVAEACMEIEAIGLEKKHLLQQWNSSLIGMRRRDEAYAAIQEALSLAQQELRSLDTEIESYKKATTKEEDRNEQLTLMYNRAESDAAMCKKLIAQCQARQEALRVEFTMYTRTLQETEQALSRVTMERAGRLSEVKVLRKQIEKEAQVKVALENNIMEKLQDKLTSGKAAKYSAQLAAKLQKRKLELEIDYSKIENEAAQFQLEVNNSSSRIKGLQKTLVELEKDIQSTTELIHRSQAEISKRTIAIERKQSSINLFSKQIEATIAQIGGKELGPLEIQITALNKQIDECNSDIVSVQQFWLRLQTDMVMLTRQREEQDATVEMLKKELTIMQQKKIRTENEIEQEKKEQKDIEYHMRNLKNDMLRLNILLSKNISSKEQLEQHNQLMESEFMHSLREAERESIGMQQFLGNIQEEKERLLHSLVEAEYQIMLWEKKIQLAKEMRNAVDSEAGQGEIRAMKSEIHRMQVRHAQLIKQQEKMIREMEAVVSRRETITTRGQGLAEKDRNHLTTNEFRGKLQELRKKIKETQKNAEECTNIVTDLQKTQHELGEEIEEKQQNISTLKLDSNSMETEIERLQEKKRQNLSEIVAYQTRMKHLQAVKDGKYTPMCSTPRSLELEQQKQETRMHAVSTIVHQIQQDYPQYQSILRNVSLALEVRLGSQEAMSERTP
ncbi:coiled-coil domain-containing protein 40 [Bombina bombina]|uniref:coiled-coil domain-containing protein 40 n=1 Tax=Bombina bombina TaxID=8345 RepID=UPI00235B2A00|nr:coiled-coil domain-containing protein 40 [Bombina bombina]